MDLFEYQAKRLFGAHGIPVKLGEVARTPDEARAAAERIGCPVVVKAQVLTGGRGKAGGVKLAATPDDAAEKARTILGLDIKGHTVKLVLVDPAVDIATEIYVAITLDRAARRALIMASAEGGMDIEQVAVEKPEAIVRVHIDPAVGLQPYQLRQLAFGIGLPAPHHAAFADLVTRLHNVFEAADATLAEVNPLILTTAGEMLALDGKVTVDASALYRQGALAADRYDGDLTDAERAARDAGLNYVDLDGSIGCLVNGAGLAMASMDVIKLFGGEPANFLDIGGGAQADKVEKALRIILADARVKAVLINIFGGITRGDEVARGIVAALGNIATDVPFVVRIVGTNAEAAQTILADAKLHSGATLAEAAQKAVQLAAERGAA
ncbi:MAG: ADP-forming succinate--CoA ligase subunit beta [Ardenticatenales bacterium]|nr:ADP-forming succinate--CoA ligase subunit beta [Ardenticatenales bacterium]